MAPKQLALRQAEEELAAQEARLQEARDHLDAINAKIKVGCLSSASSAWATAAGTLWLQAHKGTFGQPAASSTIYII